MLLTFNSGSDVYMQAKRAFCFNKPAENDHEIPLTEHCASFSSSFWIFMARNITALIPSCLARIIFI